MLGSGYCLKGRKYYPLEAKYCRDRSKYCPKPAPYCPQQKPPGPTDIKKSGAPHGCSGLFIY